MNFIDLNAQYALIKNTLNERIQAVLNHGIYIMGPEIAVLEKSLAMFGGAKYCLSCANGTDALILALMAKGVGPGDAVFIPSFTFVASAEAVVLVGATPVFVDVNPVTYNIDSESLEAAIKMITTQEKLNLKCIIAVDLFGQPADYDVINEIANLHNIFVISDAAQSYGATYKGRRVGSLAEITTTSFFPAKPLGCYGDGGAVFTDDIQLFEILKSIRVHGQGVDKYDNVRIGINSRMDTLQAAILLEKLVLFPKEIEARQAVSRRYHEALKDVMSVPIISPESTSVWAQYTLAVDGRDVVLESLKNEKIPTAIYYPNPIHRQGPYSKYPIAPSGLPISESLAKKVFSLPIHPYLDSDTQDRIILSVKRSLA
jgi:dTDP-4-amino-4,6-dideoxygalactose transaminase